MNEQPRSQYDATGQGTAGPALEQVRHTAQVLVEEGRGVEALDFVLSALAAVLSKSRELELQVAKLLRERAGRTSERVDPGQLPCCSRSWWSSWVRRPGRRTRRPRPGRTVNWKRRSSVSARSGGAGCRGDGMGEGVGERTRRSSGKCTMWR